MASVTTAAPAPIINSRRLIPILSTATHSFAGEPAKRFREEWLLPTGLRSGIP
jgi:hypothetical protein